MAISIWKKGASGRKEAAAGFEQSARRDEGELQSASPLLSGFEGDGLLYRRTVDTEHMLVLFVPEIDQGFGFLVPWIPNHCVEKKDEESPTAVLYLHSV